MFLILGYSKELLAWAYHYGKHSSHVDRTFTYHAVAFGFILRIGIKVESGTGDIYAAWVGGEWVAYCHHLQIS